MSNVNPFYSVFQAKDSPWNQHFQDSELKRIIEQEKSGIIFVLIVDNNNTSGIETLSHSKD